MSRQPIVAAFAAGITFLSVSPPAFAAHTYPGPDTAGKRAATPIVTSRAQAHGHARARGLVPRVRRGRKPPLASANPECGHCNPPLLFTRGAPVMGSYSGTPGVVTITPVYWAPPGYSFAPGYKAIVNGYLQNVAQASGHESNAFSVMTQYYQQATAVGSAAVHIRYAISVRTEVDDTDAFPAQSSTAGCLADAGFSDCVDDTGLQTELQTAASRLGLPVNDSNLYLVFFPPGVETCIGTGVASTTNECSTNDYCAYHSASDASPYLIYSNQPYPDVDHCSDPVNGPQQPNGDPYADDQVSLVSHEANEAMTDWDGTWMDSAGYENGDECAYVYGQPLGSTGGAQTLYNQVIGAGKYYTQDEFSNEDFASGRGDLTTSGGSLVPGCVQREEAPLASFAAPVSVAANSNVVFDASASSDSDGGSVLTFSWSWGDGLINATGVTATHAFRLPGTYEVTLVVTDSDGWSATQVRSVDVQSTRAVVVPASSGTAASPARTSVGQSSPAPTPRPR